MKTVCFKFIKGCVLKIFMEMRPGECMLYKEWQWLNEYLLTITFPSLCQHIVVWSPISYDNVPVGLLLLPRFASAAMCTYNCPILPSNVPGLVCKIRSSLARVDFCVQNHTSASITVRKECSSSLHGSFWSSCRPPAASRKLTAVLHHEHACSGEEVRDNVAILYLGPVAHVRAPLVALFGRIGVVLEEDICYFQFLLISLLAVLIQSQ